MRLRQEQQLRCATVLEIGQLALSLYIHVELKAVQVRNLKGLEQEFDLSILHNFKTNGHKFIGNNISTLPNLGPTLQFHGHICSK